MKRFINCTLNHLNMLTLKEHKIEVAVREKTLNVYAYSNEGDGQPIVYLHAGLQNHTAGIPILNYFSGRSVADYDMPGHGKSDVFPFQKPTLEDYLAVHLGVLQGLDIKEYTGIGHSLGGILLAYAASKKDSNLATLCMIDSIDVNPLRRLPGFVEKTTRQSESLYDPKEKKIDYSKLKPDLTGDEIRDIGFQTTPTKAVRDVLGIYPSYDARPITKPTLIIHGEDDNLIRKMDVREMARNIPKHILRFVQGGHFVVNQHPERVIEALEELKSLEGK